MEMEWQVVGPITKSTEPRNDDPSPLQETCGVCWASHMCSLPVRHDGDHACISDDDEGEPHETCPRTGTPGFGEDYLYQLDLLRYDEFCDVCGPIERADHIHAVLDHAMRAHPVRWAEEYAASFASYLGDGRWA